MKHPLLLALSIFITTQLSLLAQSALEELISIRDQLQGSMDQRLAEDLKKGAGRELNLRFERGWDKRLGPFSLKLLYLGGRFSVAEIEGEQEVNVRTDDLTMTDEGLRGQLSLHWQEEDDDGSVRELEQTFDVQAKVVAREEGLRLTLVNYLGGRPWRLLFTKDQDRWVLAKELSIPSHFKSWGPFERDLKDLVKTGEREWKGEYAFRKVEVPGSEKQPEDRLFQAYEKHGHPNT